VSYKVIGKWSFARSAERFGHTLRYERRLWVRFVRAECCGYPTRVYPLLVGLINRHGSHSSTVPLPRCHVRCKLQRDVRRCRWDGCHVSCFPRRQAVLRIPCCAVSATRQRGVVSSTRQISMSSKSISTGNVSARLRGYVVSAIVAHVHTVRSQCRSQRGMRNFVPTLLPSPWVNLYAVSKAYRYVQQGNRIATCGLNRFTRLRVSADACNKNVFWYRFFVGISVYVYFVAFNEWLEQRAFITLSAFRLSMINCYIDFRQI